MDPVVKYATWVPSGWVVNPVIGFGSCGRYAMRPDVGGALESRRRPHRSGVTTAM